MVSIYANDPSQLMSTINKKSIKLFVSHVYNFECSLEIHYLRAITKDLRSGVESRHIIEKILTHPKGFKFNPGVEMLHVIKP